jgi:hypothetical protein
MRKEEEMWEENEVGGDRRRRRRRRERERERATWEQKKERFGRSVYQSALGWKRSTRAFRARCTSSSVSAGPWPFLDQRETERDPSARRTKLGFSS